MKRVLSWIAVVFMAGIAVFVLLDRGARARDEISEPVPQPDSTASVSAPPEEALREVELPATAPQQIGRAHV